MPQSALSPTPAANKRSRLRHPLLLITGIMLVAANLRAALTSVGPLLEQIQQQLSLSATSAGLLNSLPLILFAVLSPVTPSLAKRMGIERTLGMALLLLIGGIVLRSLPQTSMLWLGTVLIGAAIAFANVVLPTLVKRDFPSRAAAMIAGYAAVMSLVAATASGLAVPLAALNNLGWRFSLLCWSLPALLALMVWLPQLRRPAASATADTSALQPAPSRSPWGSALGWQVALFMGLQSITFYTIIGWFSAFAASHGTSPQQAGFELFIYQVVAIAANFVMVFILPRARDQRAIALCSSLLIFTGIAGLLLMPANSLVWLIFAGLGAGSSLVLALSFFGLRSSHHHQATQLSGMAQSVGYLLAALGPTLFGLLHDLTQGWRLPLAILLTLTLLQMLFGILAGRNRVIR
ncbi:CynX/NimT family MFS transporter [Serratia proteamaculans]|uniref:CynX/NimT family MFS transporter n=1 Tax=Serratia proteamaculans TaxID=28151 RepID=UPI000D8EB8CF|nr:MFS transporter [Serratia proteamaculans]CAI0967965.1 Inner membrane transport protein YeaN [Serratia proteamaculans]CAI1176904.1 Inner membrane transport protein YeaN [Serratia proteamaculans]CAI1928468.1 Inner membrane transport protein YeaN [Serratia proteamaculans]SPZ51692.1 Inner membrane transport protein YeaN [Serratia quinivorans]